jgi:beta-glucosidase
MGAAEIRGIQSQHVMAMVKHFVGYDTDARNVSIDDQTLREIYVAPFEAAVLAGVASIMCSYNRLNGKFACGNESTLTRILRDELGFQGFVTSDWGATHAVSFINAGLDMEMPGPPSTAFSFRQGRAEPSRFMWRHAVCSTGPRHPANGSSRPVNEPSASALPPATCEWRRHS